jgi:outer membrane lipoprotein-sorting protein
MGGIARRLPAGLPARLVSGGVLGSLILLGVAFAPIKSSDLASASITPTTFITEINLTDKMSDGREILQSLNAAASSVDDYYCDCTMFSFKGKRPADTGAKFYYKKPGQVRIEAVTRDYRNGSVVVRNNSAIRGLGGGMLRSLKMNLEENSRMLRLPNGYCVVKTDFPSLYADVKKSIADGCKCRATKTPVEVPTVDGQQKMFVFEVSKPTASGEELVHRVLVNPKTMLPIEWAFFKDGRIITTNHFRNMTTNTGLSKDLFTI